MRTLPVAGPPLHGCDAAAERWPALHPGLLCYASLLTADLHQRGGLQERGVTPLRRRAASTLQLNIGLYCNQACSHCHVESSPLRKEAMDSATAARCIALLRRCRAFSSGPKSTSEPSQCDVRHACHAYYKL